MSKPKNSQCFFNFNYPLFPRKKTADQIAVEKILAAEQRENPEPEPSGRKEVMRQMRERMLRQKAKAADLLSNPVNTYRRR